MSVSIMYGISNKKEIKQCVVRSVVSVCVILPNVGDIIAETCRTDRNFTCVFKLCEYVGFINETPILVCLGSELPSLS